MLSDNTRTQIVSYASGSLATFTGWSTGTYSDIVDMSGWRGVRFTSVLFSSDSDLPRFRIEGSNTTDTASFATIGASTVTGNASLVNVLQMDIYRPKFRYLRTYMLAAASTDNTGTVLAEFYDPVKATTVNSSSDVSLERLPPWST